MTQTDRPGTDRGAMRHVVIVGGGFGGLAAARGLAREPVRVTLIDSRNYHLFQPLLYQVATAALSPGHVAGPIRGILRNQPNTRVLLGTAAGIDLEARRLSLADGGVVDYDFLVLAAGARHAYFGHPEWEQHAPGLKTLDDALEIRRRVLGAYEAAERTALADLSSGRELDRQRFESLLTFVIVGGGPTGVELAGAIAEIARFTLKRDFRAIDPRWSRIVLVEGSPRILNGFRPEQSSQARAMLEALGVEVRTGTTVTRVDADGVTLGDERISTPTILWAAGVAASPLGRLLGVPLDRSGRVLVQPDLSIPGHPDVFVIGDMAAVANADGSPVPGVCPAAMQMGRATAASIAATLRGRARRPFRYQNKGKLAIIGRGAGVADFGRLRLAGAPAWLAWLFIHIFFLIGFANRVLAMVTWAWAYWTSGSILGNGARLITGASWPPSSNPTTQAGPARSMGTASEGTQSA